MRLAVGRRVAGESLFFEQLLYAAREGGFILYNENTHAGRVYGTDVKGR